MTQGTAESLGAQIGDLQAELGTDLMAQLTAAEKAEVKRLVPRLEKLKVMHDQRMTLLDLSAVAVLPLAAPHIVSSRLLGILSTQQLSCRGEQIAAFASSKGC